MRSGLSIPLADDDRGGLRSFARRQASRVTGMALLAGVAFTLAALGTWNVDDPSFSHATDNLVTNAMGYPGAVVSDLAMQFFGLSSVAALVPAVIWGFLLAGGRGVDRMAKRAAAWFGAALLFAAIAGCLTPPLTWPLPTGLGGVFGDMVLKLPALLVGTYPKGLFALLVTIVLAPASLVLFAYGSGLVMRSKSLAAAPAKRAAPVDDEAFDDEDDDEGVLALGAIVHWWLSFTSLLRRSIARYRDRRPAHFDRDDDFAFDADSEERIVRPAAKRSAGSPPARREPAFAAERSRISKTTATTSTSLPRCSARPNRRKCRISVPRPAPASPARRRVRSPARACSARRRPR